MSTIANPVVTGAIDQAILDRIARLLSTPAGAIPWDRAWGIDASVLDNPPAAVEGALMVEYTRKLHRHFPGLTVQSISFEYQGSHVIPKVVIAGV
jgi:hypothetical protein